jgi:hypothetical membrane protein
VIPDRHRTLAGVSLVGVVTVSGFVTAAASFPGYCVSGDTISALGAARAPPGSRTAFTATMVVSGGLVAVAAHALPRASTRRLLPGVVGFVGVGVFPAGTGLPHFLAAMVAFVGAGVAAPVVAATHAGPFRYVSAVLGGLELLALVGFVALGGTTPLGIGGLERWVASLGLAWAIAYGGFLLGKGLLPG